MLSDLVFGLAGMSAVIHVVTSRQRYDDRNAQLPAKELIDNVRVHRIWTTRFGRQNLVGRAVDYLSFYLSAAIILLRMTKRNDVIVSKTDPPLISTIAALVGWLKSARLINWLQDLFPEVARAIGVNFVNGRLFLFLKSMRNRTLMSAHRNVALGDLMAERLRKEGIPEDKIVVVHNWADGEQIKPIERTQNSLRYEWGLSNKFVVGYSGNLGRGHEFSTVLDAAVLLKDDPDIVFLFIGGGAQLRSVQSQCERLKLSNIVFKPYQPREKLAESLSVSDIHLVTLRPRLEGLMVPSKFYGIAASGRPAIFIGDVNGEIASILESYNCGFTCKEGESKNLALLIRKLKIDPSSLYQMQDHARRLFEQKFTLRSALKQWKQLLDEQYHQSAASNNQ